LTLCSSCPRSYHFHCLEKDFKAKARSKYQFHCPQHQCADCAQKTTDAGGMLYRCRFCEKAFCEDCLDFDRTKLLGETLKEFELLDYPWNENAYYIECPHCTAHQAESLEVREFWAARAAEYDELHAAMVENLSRTEEDAEAKLQSKVASRAPSMTDATTLGDSRLATPSDSLHSHQDIFCKTKRKTALVSSDVAPVKRTRLTL
jgi:SWI/SNF-related matrix-associated actin-dependent regulator of chromatin subfamily A member 5